MAKIVHSHASEKGTASHPNFAFADLVASVRKAERGEMEKRGLIMKRRRPYVGRLL